MAHTKARLLPLALLSVPLWLCATPGNAEAKSRHTSPYTYQQTYGTALRLVKVDLNLTVTDHDPDWGYLMFEYTSRDSGKRKTRGSFEFVRTRNDVHVALQLATMPSYHERVLIDKLRRKLTAEHGTPPHAKPKKKKKKKLGEESEKSDDKAPKAGTKKRAGTKEKRRGSKGAG